MSLQPMWLGLITRCALAPYTLPLVTLLISVEVSRGLWQCQLTAPKLKCRLLNLIRAARTMDPLTTHQLMAQALLLAAEKMTPSL